MKKDKKAIKTLEQDNRIDIKYPVFFEYAAMWIILLCLTGGQALIFYEYFDMKDMRMPLSFILSNIGYWGLMTFIITVVIRGIRKKHFEKPMKKLSEAARQVAEGDFTVHIDPIRKDSKKDYIEVLFDDFNTMVDELNSIQMFTSDFTANVSHEIKTPLSVIQNYATALQNPKISDEQRKEYTDTIITASVKLNTLVTNILKLSKLENQKIIPTLEKYDLCSQLAECALNYEDFWESKNITFTADMEDKATIEADRDMLEIVWNNLLSNALKFTPNGGSITLKQSSTTETVTISISDSGCGMNETELQRIFDKFYQGDTSHSGDGNGLGLALTLRVIELMGWRISAESVIDKGSTFTVKLKKSVS